MIEIIPNWHPVVVHFAIGLLLAAAGLYAAGALINRPAVAAKATTAARWNLAIGAVFAILSVAAGYRAFYTVAHDNPAHAAMLIHLKWAWASLVLFAVAAVLAWRERTRESSASLGLGIVLAAGSAALLTTGYLGGENVYRHGLGVQRLPIAEGPGHSHEHEDAGHSHEQAATANTGSVPAEGHAHEDADGGTAPHSHEHAETGSSAGADTSTFSPSAAAAAHVIDAFQQALASGDLKAARTFLDPQVRIFEGGNVERSAEEYASHHMHSDSAFLAKAKVEVTARSGEAAGDLAWVATESEITTAGTPPKTIKSTETMLLRNTPGGWRIVHIHWSSQ